MSKNHLSTLPCSATITASPHLLLPPLLHTQSNGLPRAYADSTLLAQAIVDGWITVDDVIMPWRPPVMESLIDEILASDRGANESNDHRRLKVDARVLALASDPDAQLEPESVASLGRYPMRADLQVWHASGVSETYESGATDGRSVLQQIMDGQVRVTTLPFAGLEMPSIRGYAFRLKANPAHRTLTIEDGHRAWAQILASLPGATFSNSNYLF
jgi:hypothetical protein